jgi:hypothetical protein
MTALLFHYTSTPTAETILRTRTLRLAALSAANDSHEGRVVGEEIDRQLRSSGLPVGVSDFVSVVAQCYPDSTEGFAFCLSEKGDQLSQWRAYGDDGRGVSIGFNRSALEKDFGAVNFGRQFYELVKISYGTKVVAEDISSALDEMEAEFSGLGEFVRLADGITPSDALARLSTRNEGYGTLFVGTETISEEPIRKIMDILARFNKRCFAFKVEDFWEEKEWRLIRQRHKVALQEFKYFADDHSIRPFIECLIADPAKHAIHSVILGPKNATNIDWMTAFLATVGLDHVEVKHSSITAYR